MSADLAAQSVRLEDGRDLGFAEWGDQAGIPVFHFHGSSSSRLEHPVDRRSLDGVRLVTVDRPGHGLSDFQPERRLVDWPADVVALADHLEIDSFAVSGWSFGGPYAMVCARLIPDRLTGVALISSFAPHDRPGSTVNMARFNKLALGLARWAPWWLGRRFMNIQGNALTNKPEETAKRMLSSLPDVDREVLEQSAVIGVLVPAMTEAYRNGADGAAWEGRILVRPWGFDLSEIGMPVDIWHGDADVNNPIQSAEYLRDTIPGSHTNILQGEGHFHIFRHWGEILDQLTRT
jgi:pimeloyl-ACP methyl ester carboxylesterase